MTAREMEIIDESEIFTEALVARVALGEITVDQLKRQLDDGLAYVEARGADNVAEELLVALAAMDTAIMKFQADWPSGVEASDRVLCLDEITEVGATRVAAEGDRHDIHIS
jgi:hypothetical protein